MAAPVVESATGSSMISTGTSLSVDLGGPAEGELIIIFAHSNDTGGTATTFTLPGYTSLDYVAGSGFQSSAEVFYKTAGASETDPVTITLNQTVQGFAHAVVVSGHNGLDGTDPGSISALDETGTTVDAPSVTPSQAESLVVSFAGVRAFNASGHDWTPPGGSWVQPTQSGTLGNNQGRIESAYLEQGNSATGAVTWTEDAGSEQMYAANVVVAPVAAAGANPKNPLGLALNGPFSGPV